jgi:hypothetical protein
MQIRITEISTAMSATTDTALTKTLAAVVTENKVHPAGRSDMSAWYRRVSFQNQNTCKQHRLSFQGSRSIGGDHFSCSARAASRPAASARGLTSPARPG